ncbi:MAG: hypothetical protein KBS47_02225 [Bacteroidales bacterium]|nr:hypothetical protein [Candidatus Equimonas enterica]
MAGASTRLPLQRQVVWRILQSGKAYFRKNMENILQEEKNVVTLHR